MSQKGIVTLVGSLALLFISSVQAQVPIASFISDRSGDDEVHLVYDNGEVKQLTKNKANLENRVQEPTQADSVRSIGMGKTTLESRWQVGCISISFWLTASPKRGGWLS